MRVAIIIIIPFKLNYLKEGESLAVPRLPMTWLPVSQPVMTSDSERSVSAILIVVVLVVPRLSAASRHDSPEEIMPTVTHARLMTE